MSQQGAALRLAAAALVMLGTASAAAEEPFRLLHAREIRAAPIGRDLTDGAHWSWYYRPDGVLDSIGMGKRRTGSWKIEGDKLCPAPEAAPTVQCYEVWRSGKNISLRYEANMPLMEGFTKPHTKP